MFEKTTRATGHGASDANVLRDCAGDRAVRRAARLRQDCARSGAGEIVTLEHAPEAVRAMIERQRQGGNVGVIQRRVKNGKARYVVTIVQGGQEQRLSLTEDGRLISSRPAGDDEEDDD
ncbi:hypothetical protein GPU89_13760 [Burkholderia cepacia]|nr:hypothetical protein [Burkholderia cepacia]